MSVVVLQLHKRASYEFRYIQDKYAISSDGNSFALADGTTQSFNSEIWAEIITNQFVKTPGFIRDEVIQLFKDSVGQYKNSKFEYSSNPAKASLEKSKQSKGGTATLIGLRFLSDSMIEVIACGDSNFFLIASDDNKITPYPFSDIDSLDNNNNFINTESLIQGKVDGSFFDVRQFEYQYGDKLILATDALSRLILKKPAILNELLEIVSFEQLHAFCMKHWDNKDLQEDDISAIILAIDKDNTKSFIIPPKYFSFPKEKEEEFIPAPLSDDEIKFTNMQINEIRNQFKGIANDFSQIKKKQKFHEVLLMVAISLLLINLLYLFSLETNLIIDSVKREIHLNEQSKNRKEPEKGSNIPNKQSEIIETAHGNKEKGANSKRDTSGKNVPTHKGKKAAEKKTKNTKDSTNKE